MSEVSYLSCRRLTCASLHHDILVFGSEEVLLQPGGGGGHPVSGGDQQNIFNQLPPNIFSPGGAGGGEDCSEQTEAKPWC